MMKEQRQGTIINISSVCAKHTWPKWNVYTAAKWGVLGFSKALYVELQPYNVRVTTVLPRLSATNFQSSAGKKPVNAQLKPSDVAKAIVNICMMPSHVVIEEAVIWGIDQLVNPL